MDVTEAIAARRSVRAFLETPVDPALLHDLAVKASRAATGGNLQPWHIAIVHGEPMARLKAIMAEKIAAGATGRDEWTGADERTAFREYHSRAGHQRPGEVAQRRDGVSADYDADDCKILTKHDEL